MASHDPPDMMAALPTELLQMILMHITCTEDLSAAIRASPKLLQSFLGQRAQILIKVIQSSLDPGIFMVVLGFLHLPNLSNLNYVIGPHEVPRGISEEDLEVAYWRIRRRAQNAFIVKFHDEHFDRLDDALEPGASQPFSIPEIKRPVDQQQIARFRRAVDTVVAIFGSLRRHMQQVYHDTTLAPYRDVWVPGVPFPMMFKATITRGETEFPTWTPAIAEQRRFLRVLFEDKMMESR